MGGKIFDLAGEHGSLCGCEDRVYEDGFMSGWSKHRFNQVYEKHFVVSIAKDTGNFSIFSSLLGISIFETYLDHAI